MIEDYFTVKLVKWPFTCRKDITPNHLYFLVNREMIFGRYGTNINSAYAGQFLLFT